MIFVHVEHFLNEEGQRVFPDWLKRVANVLTGFEGFIRIRQLTKVDSPDQCHLMLEFESLEQVRKWSASEEHRKLISELAPYSLRGWQSEVYEVGRIWTMRKDGDAFLT